MFLIKLRVFVVVVVLAGTLGSGAGWVYYERAAAAGSGGSGVAISPRAGQADAKAEPARKEIADLRDELQKALARVAALEARLGANTERRAPVLYKGKPAQYWMDQLQDRSPEFRMEAVTALGGIGEVDSSVIPVLVQSLQDRDPRVCEEAVQGLLGIGKETIPGLVAALQSENQRKRLYIIRALAPFGEDAKAAVPTLIRLLKSPNQTDRLAAAHALGAFRAEAKTIVPVLIPLLKHTTDMDFYVAVDTVGQFGPEAKPAVAALIEMLKEKKPVPLDMEYLRTPARGVFGGSAIGFGSGSNRGRVGKGGPMRSGFFIPASRAAIALGKIGPDARAAVPALLEMLKNAPPQIQGAFDADSASIANAAFNALREIDPMAVPAQAPGGRRGGKGGAGFNQN